MQKAALPMVKHKHKKCIDKIHGMHTISYVLKGRAHGRVG